MDLLQRGARIAPVNLRVSNVRFACQRRDPTAKEWKETRPFPIDDARVTQHPESVDPASYWYGPAREFWLHRNDPVAPLGAGEVGADDSADVPMGLEFAS
jgi:hypothetical protein